MSQMIPIVKGTRDFYPDDMRVLNHITRVWHKTATLYGFEEFDGPIMEALDIYKQKSGEEIVNQLYYFSDKAGREIALRPELTPTLARLIVQKKTSIRKPIKWYSSGRFFRYERMQRGRKREFFQWNLDILGEDGVTAECEIIAACITAMKLYGLTSQDVVVKINDRRLLTQILFNLGINHTRMPKVFAAIDKKSKISETELERMLATAGLTPAQTQKLIDILGKKSLDSLANELLDNQEIREIIDKLRYLQSLLSAYRLAEFVQIDLSIVRGLDYYTGIVFEMFYKSENLRAICGGGRYDNLLTDFGGPPLSGVGMGMGDIVLAEILSEKRLLQDMHNGVDYYVVYFHENQMQEAIRMCATIRSKGLAAAYPLHALKMRKAIEEAAYFQAKHIIFLYEDELKEGTILLRDMKTKNESKQLIHDFYNAL